MNQRVVIALSCAALVCLAPVRSLRAGGPSTRGDRHGPYRIEVAYEVFSGGKAEAKAVGKVLRTGFVVLGEAEPSAMFIRFLFSFDDGFRAAVYVTGDFTGKEKRFQDLLVDPDAGEWVLLREEAETDEEGYAAMKRAVDEESLRAFVGFETARLRVNSENEDLFPGGSMPGVFRTAEPELVAFLQKLRRHLGEAGVGGWGVLRALPDAMAKLLALPLVPPAATHIRVAKRSFGPDEPEAAAPLDPDLEKDFGKWATWRELPNLKND